MLYILRPLIYALLVQQVEQRRKRDSNGNNNAEPTTTTTTSSRDTGTSTNNNLPGPITTTNTLVNTTSALVAAANAYLSTTSVGVGRMVNQALSALTVDALLSILALAVSFVSILCVLFFFVVFPVSVVVSIH